jgi:hypothetical protein
MTVTGSAWVDLTTPNLLVGGVSTAQTARVGALSVTQGLTLNALAANLHLDSTVQAATLSIHAQAGSLMMASNASVASVGDITLAGQTGLGVATITGATTANSAQVITLNSLQGAVTDSSVLTAAYGGAIAESVNVTTKGAVSITGKTVGGLGDADLDMAVARVDRAWATDGAAFVTFTLDPILKDINIDGALVMTVLDANEDLILDGEIRAGSVTFDIRQGKFTQFQNSSLLVRGNVTITARDDIELVRIESGGDVSLESTAGVIEDISVDSGNTSVANLVVSGGKLSLTARSIGTQSDALDIASDKLTQVIATDSFHLASQRSLVLGTLEAGAASSLVQSVGDVTVQGNSYNLTTLALSVTDGAFTQTATGKLSTANQLTVSAKGDVKLNALTSVNGNVVVTSLEGDILDGTASPLENFLITTGSATGTVTLSARNIGDATTDGDIDIDTAKLASATATQGDMRLGFVNDIVLGSLTASRDIDVLVTRGDLTLDGQLSGRAALVDVRLGQLSMASNASLATTGTTEFRSGGDMRLTTLNIGTGTLLLNAGAAIVDASASESANLVGSGSVMMSAKTIGGEGHADIDLQVQTLSSVNATAGETWLSASKGSSFDTFKLGTVTTPGQDFHLSVSTGDLLIEGDALSQNLDMSVAAGRLTMVDGVFVTAVENASLTATGDISLSTVTSTRGTIALTSSAGKLLDGTASETTNIVAKTQRSQVRLQAVGMGTTAADGDLDIDVYSLSELSGGAQGVYLEAISGLRLGAMALTGELQLVVDTSDLEMTGQASAGQTMLRVVQGSLVMSDAVAGSSPAARFTANGDAYVAVNDDIILSQFTVANGLLTMSADRGNFVDGTMAESTAQPNIEVTGSGRIVKLSALSMGDATEDGEIEISAAHIDRIQTLAGSGAAAIASVSGGQVATVAVTQAGSGYNPRAVPVVSFSGGGGSGATGVAIVNEAGQLTGVLITSAGSGYTSAPNLKIEDSRVIGSIHTEFTRGTALDELVTPNTWRNQISAGDLTLQTSAQAHAMSLTADQGKLILQADSSLTAATTLDMRLQGGLLAQANSVVSARNIQGQVGAGDVDLANKALITAADTLDFGVTTGDVNLATEAKMMAAKSLSLSVTTGDVSLSSQAKLTSGDAMTVSVGTGDIQLDHASADAAKRMQWQVGAGDVVLTASSIANGSDSLRWQIGGNVTLQQDSALTLQGITDMSLLSDFTLKEDSSVSSTGRWSLAALGQVQLRDTSAWVVQGVQNLLVGQNFELQSQASVTVTGNMLGAIGGDVLLPEQTQWHVSQDLSLAARGSVRMSDTAQVSAQTLQWDANGQMRLQDQAQLLVGQTADLGVGRVWTLSAGGQVLASDAGLASQAVGMASWPATWTLAVENEAGVSTLPSGGLSLTEDASINAGQDLSVTVRNGNASQSDEATLVHAGRDLRMDVSGNILLDWVTAGRSATLIAGDAILDNNQKFETSLIESDLIVTPQLSLQAGKGVGTVWDATGGNLNVAADVVTASNTALGGINIQNSRGFTVGSEGIWNTGNDDVVLVSNGRIVSNGVAYVKQVTPSAVAARVLNQPGQRIVVVQWANTQIMTMGLGNTTPQTASFFTSPPMLLDFAKQSDKTGREDPLKPVEKSSLVVQRESLLGSSPSMASERSARDADKPIAREVADGDAKMPIMVQPMQIVGSKLRAQPDSILSQVGMSEAGGLLSSNLTPKINALKSEITTGTAAAATEAGQSRLNLTTPDLITPPPAAASTPANVPAGTPLGADLQMPGVGAQPAGTAVPVPAAPAGASESAPLRENTPSETAPISFFEEDLPEQLAQAPVRASMQRVMSMADDALLEDLL